MKVINYRMISFEGDLDEVTRKFNAWASGVDGIEIINVQFVPLTFDTYANRHGVIVFYKKVHTVEKYKPAEQSTPNALDSEIGQETLKNISRELTVIRDALSFGYCSRCQGPTHNLKHNIHELKRLLGWNDTEDDKTTVEYAGDGNTTWRTETKEEKYND